MILLGDFNTRQNHPLLIQLFEQPGVVDAVNAALGSKKTAEKVDWIITRGFNVLGGGMTPLGISDHPAFWVDLAIEVSD